MIIRHHGDDTTNYKKVHLWNTAPFRLYNLEHGPHEKNDLVTSHPEIAQRLKKKSSNRALSRWKLKTRTKLCTPHMQASLLS
ncbi:MAG: hypothetical protein P8N49_01195 [Opitutales bacterium]|nr:hypothetical protein [Opitutales bacterium]